MKDNQIIETKRCRLYKFNISDAAHMFELNSDPVVIQYTGDTPFDSIEDAQKFIKNYDQYEKCKMGRWSVYDKDSDEYLGWCGLKYHPTEKMVDLGYRFHRRHWNKGYASECGSACLEYGFMQLNLSKIVAHAMIENVASYKVMEKIGMQFIKKTTLDEKPAVLYSLKKEDWLKNQSP